MKKQHRLSIKKIAILLTVIYLLSLIPLLLLANYDYPSADDYGFSVSCHQMWMSSHSVWKTLGQAVLTAQDRWHTWQGTFSSIFLFALQPAIWGEAFYGVTTWIILILLSVSVIWLMKVLILDCLHADKSHVICVSVIVLFFTVQRLVDGVQGLYWYNGAVHYMVMHSAYLVLTALQIRQLTLGEYRRGSAGTDSKEDIRGKKDSAAAYALRILGCAFLSVMVGGGNYVTALLYLITLVTLWGMILKTGRAGRRRMVLYAVPTILFLGSFTVNVLAPGNAVRQASFTETPGVMSSILLSFSSCLQYVFGSWTDWTTALMILLLIPFAMKIVRYTGYSFRYPMVVCIYSFCCLSAMFTPTLYATGNIGAGRIHNIIYSMYLILLACDVIYVAGWAIHKWGTAAIVTEASEERENYKSHSRFGEAASAYLCGIAVITIGAFGIAAYTEPDTFTSTSALYSLLSGEAETYGEICSERTELLRDDTTATVILPRFETFPILLYFDDISTESDWKSERMCWYYGKESILLEP